jgi:hypothetical protein
MGGEVLMLEAAADGEDEQSDENRYDYRLQSRENQDGQLIAG